MADKDDIRDGKNFYEEVQYKNEDFYLKGAGSLDWGMQNRLSRIFNPATGKTVMLAFDHGYFQGPTTGLENLKETVAPLLPNADCLFVTRGMLRNCIDNKTNVRMININQLSSVSKSQFFITYI